MAMNRTLMKLVSSLHSALYGSTGGRVAGSVYGAPVLLLTTTGRKSGSRRTAPLVYMPDGDNYVVVGSNAGNDEHPAWYLNLRSNAAAEIQIGREKQRVTAQPADGEERARLWRSLVDLYPNYGEYQKGTARQIPVVVLRPAERA